MNIEFVDEISSTNDILLEKGREGWCEDTVLVAFCQSMGRGRSGRSFYSPAKSGLYMSLLLHPFVRIEEVFGITTLMAVAAAEAIEEYAEKKVDIKWVNDLYIDGRKISGILTECSPQINDGIPAYIVTGIGINLFSPKEGFPSDIQTRAGAVFDGDVGELTDNALTNLKKGLAYSVVEHFEKYYEDFPFVTYFNDYKKRMFLTGKKVEILNGPTVTVKGIDNDFGLMVQHEDGHEEILRAGEVSLLV